MLEGDESSHIDVFVRDGDISVVMRRDDLGVVLIFTDPYNIEVHRDREIIANLLECYGPAVGDDRTVGDVMSDFDGRIYSEDDIMLIAENDGDRYPFEAREAIRSAIYKSGQYGCAVSVDINAEKLSLNLNDRWLKSVSGDVVGKSELCFMYSSGSVMSKRTGRWYRSLDEFLSADATDAERGIVGVDRH